eukprot:5081716-Pleurochrysis_carterae.AAC.3
MGLGKTDNDRQYSRRASGLGEEPLDLLSQLLADWLSRPHAKVDAVHARVGELGHIDERHRLARAHACACGDDLSALLGAALEAPIDRGVRLAAGRRREHDDARRLPATACGAAADGRDEARDARDNVRRTEAVARLQ